MAVRGWESRWVSPWTFELDPTTERITTGSGSDWVSYAEFAQQNPVATAPGSNSSHSLPGQGIPNPSGG